MKFHATIAAESMRLWLFFVLVPNKTISTFSSAGEKTAEASDLNFRQIKLTNVGNNTSKVQSLSSVTVGMACD